jgi:hypothetical protein
LSSALSQLSFPEPILGSNRKSSHYRKNDKPAKKPLFTIVEYLGLASAGSLRNERDDITFFASQAQWPAAIEEMSRSRVCEKAGRNSAEPVKFDNADHLGPWYPEVAQVSLA